MVPRRPPTLLGHDAGRYEKCLCILSSVNAIALSNMKKSRANSSISRTDVPTSHRTG